MINNVLLVIIKARRALTLAEIIERTGYTIAVAQYKIERAGKQIEVTDDGRYKALSRIG